MAVALAGCGSSGDTAQAPSRCQSIPGPLRSSIVESLNGKAQLGKTAAVESRTAFPSAPVLLRNGVWFVSSAMSNGAIATWAVSDGAWRTGSGMIVDTELAAQDVSNAGADVHPEQWNIDAGADGYNESRDCVS